MYSHVACDAMKERTLYLLKPSSLIWHLMPYLFLLKIYVTLLGSFLIGHIFFYSGELGANRNVLGKLGMKLAIVFTENSHGAYQIKDNGT